MDDDRNKICLQNDGLTKNCQEFNERPFTIAKNSYCKYNALSTNLCIDSFPKRKGSQDK